ncbi:MAG: ribosomal RNA small subunit methyltransferase A [Elusimicrobia bacterium]|nr:ribosomal RNA small subunit methyltransferase A [Elusimicrobiota bacterium]
MRRRAAPFGQHFLVHPKAADRIVESLQLNSQDRVLEVGAGKGVLTGRILRRPMQRLWAVELDPHLCSYLKKRFTRIPQLTLVEGDFLKLDLSALCGEGAPLKFIGNLPYAVAVPILQKVLAYPSWSCAVWMVQKEVAERIAAKPGDGRMGLLSHSVQIRARVEWVCSVPARCFRPVPKVDSAVLRLLPLDPPLVWGAQEIRFFKILRAAFSQRRKMAVNALAHGLGIPKARVTKAFQELGLGPFRRAEELDSQALLRLGPKLLPLD